MSDVTCASENPERFYKLKRKIRNLKHGTKLKLHGYFWKILWLTKLAVPYSKFACKHGFYKKYLDGRCHWCGKVHK